MSRAVFPFSHPTQPSSIPQDDLLQNFSTRVERYTKRTGCYPLAEPWYSGCRVTILASHIMTRVQLDAFEDELYSRIQHDLPFLCAAV